MYHSKLFLVFFRISKFFCVNSCSFIEENKLEAQYSKLSIFYYARIIIFAALFTTAKLRRTFEYLRNFFLVRGVFLIATNLTSVIVILIWYNHIRKQKKFVKVYNSLQTYAYDLCDAKTIQNELDEILMYEFIACIIIFASISTADLINGRISDFVAYTLPEIFVFLSILNFSNILFILKSKCKHVNKKLRSLESYSFEGMRNIYIHLKLITQDLNKLYGFFILILTTHSFIWVTHNFYKFISMHQFGRPTPNMLLSYYISIVWNSLHIAHIVIIIILCDGIQKENKSFTNLAVDKLLQSGEENNVREFCKFCKFS